MVETRNKDDDLTSGTYIYEEKIYILSVCIVYGLQIDCLEADFPSSF